MKRFISTIALGVVLGLGLVACGGVNNNETNGESPESGALESSTEDKVQVGLVTDTGGVNDRSFNEGTWNGISRFWKENPDLMGEPRHILPSNMTLADFVTAAESLIDAGKELIFMSGFTFIDAIGELQELYPETKFVIIDADPELMDNSHAILFAEQEAGFLAGIAAALETASGSVGFIGGQEIPPVQSFGWGFLAGVAYANDAFDLNVEVGAYQYQGSFDNAQAGATLAGGMYDMGIDMIFVAAGNVGNGVIAEAKTRAEDGENVFVIGVDSDQYEEGILSDGRSIILTSAIKRVDQAAYDSIVALINDEFPGGEVLIKNARDNGVGLPEENPNLSAQTQELADEALEKIKDGELVIPNSTDELESWFAEYGFDASGINY